MTKPGNAFPHFTEDAFGRAIVTGGMSIRQFYAAFAMHALIVAETESSKDHIWLSTVAFGVADTMVAAEAGVLGKVP